MCKLNFTPRIQSSCISFEEILGTANKYLSSLSVEQYNKIKESVNHGLANLSSKGERMMYMSLFGSIHKSKLELAYSHIPRKVWSEGAISVVDYGCGQAIAEVVLSYFLSKRFFGVEWVNDFILIEPSQECLVQGVKYLKKCFPDSQIKCIVGKAGQLEIQDINPANQTVLHILSNVIDIPEFERAHVAELLNSDFSHNNIIVCVSPYYQEHGRGSLMVEFSQLLKHYDCVYKIDKHTNDWNNAFSCQMRIFCSSYYNYN